MHIAMRFVQPLPEFWRQSKNIKRKYQKCFDKSFLWVLATLYSALLSWPGSNELRISQKYVSIVKKR